MLSTLIQQEWSNGEHSFAGAGLPNSPATCNESYPRFVLSFYRFSQRLQMRTRSMLTGPPAGRGDEAPLRTPNRFRKAECELGLPTAVSAPAPLDSSSGNGGSPAWIRT